MKKYETPDVEYIEFYSKEEVTSGDGMSNPGDDIWTPEDEF